MYNIAYDEYAEKEFLNLDKDVQKLVSTKILDLRNGTLTKDKPLKGKHKGKYRKRVGNYRIIYLKEKNLLVITVISV